MLNVKCRKCLTQIEHTVIGKHTNGALKRKAKDGRLFIGTRCPDCSLAMQRISRSENANKLTRKYEKTINGFLMRLYRNMQSRVTGVQKLKHHLYSGKCLLPRIEFYAWAKSSSTFYVMFSEWETSGYDQCFTPTVDRKDSTKGYSVDNMEWVTHSENSRRGSISRRDKKAHASRQTQL